MRNSRFWAVLGAVWLCLTATGLLGVAALPLRDLAVSEAQGRARLVISAVTAQIQRAVDLDIPVRELVGISALFEQNVQGFPDLLRLELRDASGLLLYEAGHPQAEIALLAIEMPLRYQGSVAGQIVVFWKSPKLSDFIRESWLPLVALLAFGFTLAREALRMAVACYPASRDALVRQACARIGMGEIGFAIASTGRRDHDARPQWLAARLRHVREQFQRLERITQSLLRTEPEVQMRLELERGLQEARGDDQLQAQAMVWLTGTGVLARQRWHGVLLGLVIWLPLMLPMGGVLLPFQVLLPFAVQVILLLWLPHWLGWQPKAGVRGLLLGGLLLGPGLGLLMQIALAPAMLDGHDQLVQWGLTLQSLLALCAGFWPDGANPVEACDVT